MTEMPDMREGKVTEYAFDRDGFWASVAIDESVMEVTLPASDFWVGRINETVGSVLSNVLNHITRGGAVLVVEPTEPDQDPGD
jgi:hypothetical protein